MNFFDMESINDLPLNLHHVMTIEKHNTGTELGCSTIKVNFSNGDSFNYRYKEKTKRDRIFEQLKNYEEGVQRL